MVQQVSNWPGSPDNLPTNLIESSPAPGAHAQLHNWTDDALNKMQATLIALAQANTGSAIVVSGTSSISPAHGLGTASIRVTAAPQADPGSGRWWISAKTSTTFTITFDGPVAASVPFDWRAVVQEE